MVVRESPAESVGQGILGAWEVRGLERHVVLDPPVPKVDALGPERKRHGASLIVDVHNCCDVVRDQLNMVGSDERKKHPACETDCPEFLHIDRHAGFSWSPDPLGCVMAEMGSPADASIVMIACWVGGMKDRSTM